MSVKFNDYSENVLVKFAANKIKALNAAGIKAVGLIVRQMESGYERPIRQTGDLMRDVSYDIVGAHSVRVGNTLDYSLYVHEGTRKMGARHYITSALITETAKEAIQNTYKHYLSEGFE